MNNEININEIVKIEQMPIVFSQLEKIGAFIAEKTKDLDELECTEENKVEVKNRRTEINNTLKILEDRRKEIKNKILEPYDIFNKKYEQECKEQLENASNLLKDKIDVIENEQKQQKEEELREFVKQHCEANHINIDFETIGLNITLSASMKSLKDQALAFIEKVANDLKLIEMEEYKDEILLEYNKTYDFVTAKTNVIERHRQLEEIAKQQEIKQQLDEQDKKVEEVVEEITAPKEIIEEDEIVEVNFTITGTLSQIKALKEYIEKEGLKYE
jgi:hypothetical protein